MSKERLVRRGYGYGGNEEAGVLLPPERLGVDDLTRLYAHALVTIHHLKERLEAAERVVRAAEKFQASLELGGVFIRNLLSEEQSKAGIDLRAVLDTYQPTEPHEEEG